MTLKEYRNHFKTKLKAIYPDQEVGSFFYLLTEKFLNLKRVDVALDLHRKLTENECIIFNKALQQLEHEVPIQYILGETEFYDLPFKVNPSVLIPRPETEELVDWVIKDFSEVKGPINILDIGTGSGCIAIAIAKNLLNAKVAAMDISAKALKIAKENAHLNEVDISIVEQDILAVKELNSTFDVIVSNPPYVKISEKQKMQHNVLLYEPHSALFVSDSDPLVFYRNIAELAHKCLHQKGNLYFEINEAYGNEVVEMLWEMGYVEVVLKNDLFGKNRMIKATKSYSAFLV